MAVALHERWETWRRARPWRAGGAAEPGRALFAEVRRRLTFWYIGVLTAALVLAGAVLYVGVRQTLLRDVDQTLSAATRSAGVGRPGGGPLGCPFRGPPPPPGARTIGIACYTTAGALVFQSDSAVAAPALTSGAIVAEAARHGTAYDTIDGGEATGQIRRYATTVRNADPTRGTGIVLYGASIRSELDALRTLLIALVVTGVLALVAAALGGLFLAARALDPLRLALQRQRAFIADASHELRTPLTLLRADADVLLRSRHRLADEDAELVADIAAEAAHMSVLTTTMLDMARLDAGEAHLERDVVDLGAIVREAVRRTDAYARAADVSVVLAPGGEALILGDRTLLTQAMLILLDNAIKYNRAGGGVTVRADRMSSRAVIVVADTGMGIAAADLRRLGERFYRSDKARSRETGGAGLGIAIALTIATLHGGTLTFASTPGEGTTATLALPAASGSTERPTQP